MGKNSIVGHGKDTVALLVIRHFHKQLSGFLIIGNRQVDILGVGCIKQHGIAQRNGICILLLLCNIQKAKQDRVQLCSQSQLLQHQLFEIFTDAFILLQAL